MAICFCHIVFYDTHIVFTVDEAEIIMMSLAKYCLPAYILCRILAVFSLGTSVSPSPFRVRPWWAQTMNKETRTSGSEDIRNRPKEAAPKQRLPRSGDKVIKAAMTTPPKWTGSIKKTLFLHIPTTIDNPYT